MRSGLRLTSLALVVVLLAGCAAEESSSESERGPLSLSDCSLKEGVFSDYDTSDPEAFETSEADAVAAFRGVARPAGTDVQVSPGHWLRVDDRGEPIVWYGVSEILPGRYAVGEVEICAPAHLQPTR